MTTELFQGPCGTWYSSNKVQVLAARGGGYFGTKLYQSKDNKSFDVNVGIPESFQHDGKITHLRITPQYERIEIIVGPGDTLYDKLYLEFFSYWHDAKIDMQHVGMPTVYAVDIHRLVFDQVCKIIDDPNKINAMIMKEVEYQMKEAYKAGVNHEKNRVRNILGL